MGLMGDGARLLNARQNHDRHGATGDSELPAVAVTAPATATAAAPATVTDDVTNVAVLLPAPREGDALAVPAADAATPALLAELPDEDTLALREEAEIEARHRRAAEHGDPFAMSALGTLLLRRGDLDGAEPYLREAVQHGDRAAANNLGLLLHQRGYADDAAGWWRIAAVSLPPWAPSKITLGCTRSPPQRLEPRR